MVVPSIVHIWNEKQAFIWSVLTLDWIIYVLAANIIRWSSYYQVHVLHNHEQLALTICILGLDSHCSLPLPLSPFSCTQNKRKFKYFSPNFLRYIIFLYFIFNLHFVYLLSSLMTEGSSIGTQQEKIIFPVRMQVVSIMHLGFQIIFHSSGKRKNKNKKN